MPIKLTIEYIRDFLKTKGYILLTETYQNARQKLKIVCQNGHIREGTFSRLGYKDQRCAKCVGIESRLTMDSVRQLFESKGYSIISGDYRGFSSNLTVRCPFGHTWATSVHGFKKSKHGCPHCHSVNNRRYTLEEVREFFANKQYKLISAHYAGNSQKLQVICPSGHSIMMSLQYFNRGIRCSICSKKAKYTLEDIRVIFQKEGYQLKSQEYKGAKTPT